MSDDLLELAARCEAATGLDRELDCAIGVAIGRFFTEPNKGWPERLDYVERRGDVANYPGHGFDQLVPRYTASLDAAMTLVPEGTRLQYQNFGDIGGRHMWLVSPNERFVSAAPPALALCAAALRARSAGGC